MSQINTIEVGITLETLALAQKGFGMPLITGTKVRTGKPDYVEVTDADQLLDASIGFVAGDAEYKMVLKKSLSSRLLVMRILPLTWLHFAILEKMLGIVI